MKSLIASIIILSFIMIITVCGSIYVSSTLRNLENDVQRIDLAKGYNDVHKQLNCAEERHQRSYFFYSLLLDDDAVEQTDAYLCDIKSSAEAESAEGVLTAKNRLIAHLEQIRRLSTFNIESIF